jgi:hypothetical protein
MFNLPGSVLFADLGHPLNLGRVAWWLGLPDTLHPGGWIDLIQHYNAVRTWTGGLSTTVRDRQVLGVSGDLLTPSFRGGTNDKFTVNNFRYPRTALTLAAWVYPTNLSFGGHSLVGDYVSAGARSVLLHTFNAKLQGYLTTNSGISTATSSATVSLSKWSFLAFTWDGSTVRCYINGSLDGTASRTGTITAPPFNLNLGFNTDAFDWYQGYMLDAGVWNRALTAGELKQYMHLTSNLYAGMLHGGPLNVGVAAASTDALIRNRRAARVAPLEPAAEHVW